MFASLHLSAKFSAKRRSSSRPTSTNRATTAAEAFLSNPASQSFLYKPFSVRSARSKYHSARDLALRYSESYISSCSLSSVISASCFKQKSVQVSLSSKISLPSDNISPVRCFFCRLKAVIVISHLPLYQYPRFCGGECSRALQAQFRARHPLRR